MREDIYFAGYKNQMVTYFKHDLKYICGNNSN